MLMKNYRTPYEPIIYPEDIVFIGGVMVIADIR
jgi:hypothetical protein